MAKRMKLSLTSHLLGTAIVIHIALLPLVYSAAVYIVANTLEQQFVDQARTYAKFIADTLEEDFRQGSSSAIDTLLDRAVLGSSAVYAELREHSERLAIASMASQVPSNFKEDFTFNGNGDLTYYLSMPISTVPARATVLRLGFEEQPTMEQIARVKRQTALVLASYFAVALLLALLLGRRIARPLKSLRDASRKIADGEHAAHLAVRTPVFEIDELAHDLERMRVELVGVNRRLQQQIEGRHRAELVRLQLESELRRAQRLETMGTFAGGIAHEFNNILQPLMLYTELAQDGVHHDSAARAHLTQVANCAVRAKTLVKKILAFSRDPGPETRQNIALAPVIEDALSLARAMLPSSIEIQADFDPGLDPVYADPLQVHQVVLNLLTNASFAMSNHGGLLRIQLANCGASDLPAANALAGDGGRFVRLVVADTGRGIDDATMQRVFEPFFTTREVGQGTGLGLSVVHGIVTAHGGLINIESTVGSGTRVSVFLPSANSG